MLQKAGWKMWVPILALGMSLQAIADSRWNEIKQQAQGQTVYFNAWGGDTAANNYLRWVATEMKQHYAITVERVPLADTADAVRRIQTEASAGRQQKGSIDLLWVNGENFSTLKQAGLLYGGWAERLPNWRYVNLTLPVREDFSVPTEGAESPWGSAQLTFIADRRQLSQPVSDPQALLALAREQPGRLSYPRPPDFTGMAFLEQLLLSLSPTPQLLKQPPDVKTFPLVTAPLWHYLDQLHPSLWRQGKDFPASAARMDRMLADGVLKISLTFNPAHAASLIANGQLPDSAYTFGFSKGMLGNVHFVAIPVNANAKAGAQVLANFLLSPRAQIRKADPRYWGDPSVLDSDKLPPELRRTTHDISPSAGMVVPVLSEPNAGWSAALEAEWLRRYGVH
ncbi:ABC transporter substrate-binding protein [Salmonella enterica subsp. enterica serovar Haifa]|nr:ABC transporter substrate-binding protein [Salmonella enterica subsp. enterica serovar Haifa]